MTENIEKEEQILTFEKLIETTPTSQINSELIPTLRCYHCNKLLSSLYEELFTPNLDLEKFFEKESIERYCCKLCLVQDYYAYYDLALSARKDTEKETKKRSPKKENEEQKEVDL